MGFFFSRVLNSSQNDGISASEEHMLCQCRVCCQLFPGEILEDHLQVSLALTQSISPDNTCILTERLSLFGKKNRNMTNCLNLSLPRRNAKKTSPVLQMTEL